MTSDLVETTAIAEELLSAALGGPVRLDTAAPVEGRDYVFRFTVLEGPADAPARVIVKRARVRGNLQKLAAELNVAYNTARNRMDDIVAALEGPPAQENRADHTEVLDLLAAGAISFEEAMRLLNEGA